MTLRFLTVLCCLALTSLAPGTGRVEAHRAQVVGSGQVTFTSDRAFKLTITITRCLAKNVVTFQLTHSFRTPAGWKETIDVPADCSTTIHSPRFPAGTFTLHVQFLHHQHSPPGEWHWSKSSN